MLTRRENLLIRPWQERRYINHRIKVETALPVIDNNPPQFRHHVNCKMKKFQKEKERCSQIISDNFTLLQHLADITRTTRVDNAWDEQPPNFLNRVGIYSCRRESRCSEMDEKDETLSEPKTRKDRCYGCSPQRYVTKVCIPEERMPFPPPKQKLSRKLQSPSDSVILKPRKTRSAGEERKQKEPKKKLEMGQEKRRVKRKQRHPEQESQSLLLSRGCLTLKLHFPADSGVVFSNRGHSKVIQNEFCHCAASFGSKLE